ncbi:MAG: sugar phosphate isomerase/epimerase [Verrucomicrobiae bacterium]|nr:sugar phosphate isomerase/epimerase [Verrucomicrobiae bacterium]
MAGLGAAAGGIAGCRSRPEGWAVACRDAHLKETGQPDCWAALRFLGIGGLEVDVKEDMSCPSMHHPTKKYSLASDDGIGEFARDLEAAGASVTAFCMHNHLDERLEEEVAWTGRLVAAAERLKVGVIRIDVVPRKVPVAEFLPFAIGACKRLCDVAAGTAVRFGVENHGKITNDPAFLDALFNGVGSERLGLTFDAMNFYWFGHPLDELYGIYERFASRALHTHCKNLRYPEDKRNVRREMGFGYRDHAAPVYDGDIDYRRVAAILRKAGYRGDLCLENECLALRKVPEMERAEVLRREIALLKEVASG